MSTLPKLQVIFLAFAISGIEHAIGGSGRIGAPQPRSTAQTFYKRDGVLIDCYPEQDVNEEKCEQRGCLWKPIDTDGAPWCIIPPGAHGYAMVGTVKQMSPESKGFSFNLMRINSSVLYDEDIFQQVKVDVFTESDYRLRIKMYPVGVQRFEVPVEIDDPASSYTDNALYEIRSNTNPEFGIKVIRRETGAVVFDTDLPGFIFSDQFIQISTRLPSNNVYGFGEHNHRRFLHDMNWKMWTIFTRDAAPVDPINLYGAHPVYMNLENDGKANMVFLKNSNAMDIILQPSPYPAITYRTIGGILDFYIFLGPTPAIAVQQYTEAIGRPVMPPYWGLGFHLCKYGYDNITVVKDVVERQKSSHIPQDVQWIDIDHMYEKLDFTYSRETFNGLPEFVRELKAQGQKLVPIQDIAIGSEPEKIKGAAINSPGYRMCEDLVESGVYVKNGSGDPLYGEVWPGVTLYPDFTNITGATEWWLRWMKFLYYNESVEFSGIWIDMNEPSSFIPGSLEGCEHNRWNKPPYCPNVLGKGEAGILYDKTICMDAQQAWGRHYDVHNLFGHSHSVVTNKALKELFPGKRPFLVTRSQFAGTGRWAAKWQGDNRSQWSNMHWSIIFMLEYSLFGFAFTGADICGFWGDAEYELCIRWQQLGSFYPFARNHNGRPFKAQDPAVLGGELVRIARNALMIRYKLLPHMYTLLHESHTKGLTMARPLMFEFPTDNNARSIDRQFLLGSGFLVTPVLDQGARTVKGYFPHSRWFDYYTGEEIKQTGTNVTLDAPLDKINLHIRGGHILPWQDPANTTVYSRKNDMGLMVAVDKDGLATGSLFWDDGESDETHASGHYLLLKFSMPKAGRLNLIVEHNQLVVDPMIHVREIEFCGFGSNIPKTFTVDGKHTVTSSKIVKDDEIVRLDLTHLALDITANHTIEWLPFCCPVTGASPSSLLPVWVTWVVTWVVAWVVTFEIDT